MRGVPASTVAIVTSVCPPIAPRPCFSSSLPGRTLHETHGPPDQPQFKLWQLMVAIVLLRLALRP